MENSLLAITIITGPIVIIVGLILFLFPPKKINSFYGYRTSSSMKSVEIWNFSQIYAAKEMIKLGGIFTLLTFAGLMFKSNGILETFFGITLLLSMFLILRVERAIKNKFKNENDSNNN